MGAREAVSMVRFPPCRPGAERPRFDAQAKCALRLARAIRRANRAGADARPHPHAIRAKQGRSPTGRRQCVGPGTGFDRKEPERNERNRRTPCPSSTRPPRRPHAVMSLPVMAGLVPLLSGSAIRTKPIWGAADLSPLPPGGRGRGRASRRARTVAGLCPPPRRTRRTLRMAALAPPLPLARKRGEGDLQPAPPCMSPVRRRGYSRDGGSGTNTENCYPCIRSVVSPIYPVAHPGHDGT